MLLAKEEKPNPPVLKRTRPFSAFTVCLSCYGRNVINKAAPTRETSPPKTRLFANIREAKPLRALAIRGLALVLAISAAANLPVALTSALGVENDLLTDCQSIGVSCVSSQDDTPASFLEPWEYDEDLTHLQNRLISILQRDYRASLLVRESRYLRFEIALSSTAIDDLEFFFPIQDNIVHFRSARRSRAFDFLQNRRRLDAVRKKAQLVQIPVLRNRMSSFKIFETPFDEFGPSAVDVDALIENESLGARPVR